MTIVKGGTNICGLAIGVLSLESWFPKPPGHIKNPSSLPFTLDYEILDGLTIPKLLEHPSTAMIAPICEAAQRLERRGVRAITGSCGFLALYQREIAQAVRIPVFASSLVQAPMLHVMTGRPVGVITASASALSQRHLEGAGAGDAPLVIEGMQDGSEFGTVILRNERFDMDLELVEAELLDTGRRLLERAPEVGSILLECTDLPPYAHRLQTELQRPVFDIITLAGMVYNAILRRPFSGFVH